MLQRLPFEPLLTRVGVSSTASSTTSSPGPFLDRIGVTRSSWTRWRASGIPWYWADRAAAAYGLHPCEVWGEAWWDLPLPAQCRTWAEKLSTRKSQGHATTNAQGSHGTVDPVQTERRPDRSQGADRVLYQTTMNRDRTTDHGGGGAMG